MIITTKTFYDNTVVSRFPQYSNMPEFRFSARGIKNSYGPFWRSTYTASGFIMRT